MCVSEPQISIVVPTLNEAENLPPLLQRVSAALVGRDYEIILVDDNSRDNTKQVAADLAKQFPVRLITREKPDNGLGGAVLHGLHLARGQIFVVMDADLQHPPERLPDLVAPLERESGAADFVVGSRHVAGASTGENWGMMRKLNSDVATLLARPFAGRTKDPMSGFFAFRRETFENAQRLTPLGYKIGLELMCKCRVQNVQEIPIHFAERTHGESKLSMREQFRYLEHLSRLYDFCYPHLSPIFKFLVVMFLGLFVSLAMFEWLLVVGVGPLMAPIFSYPLAIFVTAIFYRRYIRTQREFLVERRPWLDFIFVALAEWASCSLVSLWLSSRAVRAHAIEVFLITFASAMVARYVLRKELMQDVRGLRKSVGDDDAG